MPSPHVFSRDWQMDTREAGTLPAFNTDQGIHLFEGYTFLDDFLDVFRIGLFT